MASWTRRTFSSIGLTQVPPGPHLGALQSRFGGTVMLMIDVSGSMDGMPIREAVRGAGQFVLEAVEVRYRVGVLLWNTVVTSGCEPTDDGSAARNVLARASAGGGTSLLSPLAECHRILDQYTGDRVVALFGDGDLGPRDAVLSKIAEMKAQDIRFVTRGLGPVAAVQFGEISDEDSASARVDRVEDLATGIATMAGSLKSDGLRSSR